MRIAIIVFASVLATEDAGKEEAGKTAKSSASSLLARAERAAGSLKQLDKAGAFSKAKNDDGAQGVEDLWKRTLSSLQAMGNLFKNSNDPDAIHAAAVSARKGTFRDLGDYKTVREINDRLVHAIPLAWIHLSVMEKDNLDYEHMSIEEIERRIAAMETEGYDGYQALQTKITDTDQELGDESRGFNDEVNRMRTDLETWIQDTASTITGRITELKDADIARWDTATETLEKKLNEYKTNIAKTGQDVASLRNTNDADEQGLLEMQKDQAKEFRDIDKNINDVIKRLQKLVKYEAKYATKSLKQEKKEAIADNKAMYRTLRTEIYGIKKAAKDRYVTQKDSYKKSKDALTTAAKIAKKENAQVRARLAADMVTVQYGAKGVKERALQQSEECDTKKEDSLREIQALDSISTKSLATVKQQLQSAASREQSSFFDAAREAKTAIKDYLDTTVDEETGDFAADLDSLKVESNTDVSKLTSSSESTVGFYDRVGREIGRLKDRTRGVAGALADAESMLRTYADNVTETMQGAQAEEAGALGVLDQNLRANMDKAYVDIRAANNTMNQEVEDAALDARNGLQTRLDDLVNEFNSTIESKGRDLNASGLQVLNLIASFNSTLANVHEDYSALERDLPPVKELVINNVSSVEEAMLNATGEFDALQHSVTTALDEKDAATDAEFQGMIGEEIKRFQDQFMQENGAVIDHVQNMKQTATDLAEQVDLDNFAFAKFEDRTTNDIRGIEKNIQRTEYGLKDGEVAAESVLTNADGAMAGADGGGDANTKNMIDQTINGAASAAQTEGQGEIREAALQGDAERRAYAENQIAMARALKANETAMHNEDQQALSALTDAEKVLANKAMTAEERAAATTAARAKEIRNLQMMAEKYERDMATMTDEERAEAMKQKELIEAEARRLIGDLTLNANGELSEEEAKQHAQLMRLMHKVYLAEGDQDAYLLQMEEFVGNIEKDMEEHHKEVTKNMLAAGASEEEIAARLMKDREMVHVERERSQKVVHIGVSELQNEINSIERQGLTNLDSVLDALDSSDEKAQAEINAVMHEIDLEIAKNGKIGEEKAQELGSRLLRLITHAPDYAANFNTDTATAQDDLTDSETKMDDALDMLNTTFGQFRQMVNNTGRLRKQLATALYNRLSDVRLESSAEAQELAGRVFNLTNAIATIKDDVLDEIDGYEGNISELSGVKVDAEKEEAENLTKQVNALLDQHHELMIYMDKEKHRTFLWREAVEEKLYHLNGEVGKLDMDVAKDEADEKLAMGEAMGQFYQGANNLLASGSRDISAEELKNEMDVASEVKRAGDKIALQGKERTQQQDNARRDVEWTTAANDNAVKTVGDNDANLKAKAVGVEAAAQNAGQLLDDMSLRDMSNNPQNMETDRRMSDLETTLHTLSMYGGGPGSLLQTGASVRAQTQAQAAQTSASVTAVSAYARANLDAKRKVKEFISGLSDSELQKRVVAMKAFKEDLKARNEKLAKQNQYLSKGLTRLRSKHHLTR